MFFLLKPVARAAFRTQTCISSKQSLAMITSRSRLLPAPAALSRSFSSTGDQDLLVSKSDGLLTLQLNRPTKLNSIKQSMYHDFVSALQSATSDPDVKMVLLTGSGAYYSAGNDLSAFASVSDPAAALKDALRTLDLFLSTLIDFPKPLVVGVNGPAIGIMVTTLALADIVWCSPTATFSAPFSATAQSPEGCSTRLFPVIFGRSLANEVLMLNRKLDAKEALHRGLVSRIIECDQWRGDQFLDQVTKDLKESIANFSTESMAATKSLIFDKDTREALKKVMRNENDVLVQRWMSDEFPTFIMKFMSKKKSK